MALSSKLALIREMIDSAESNLRSAKQMLSDLGASGTSGRTAVVEKARMLEPINLHDGDETIVEGIFDGQKMMGPDEKSYPIPANYASKSKLIQGDVLKLTIMPDGAFLYKQIGPAERKRLVGVLVHEDGQYRVLAGGKAYKVLLASVTYYRASIGDQITLLVPEFEESDWGAIENVLPAAEADPAMLTPAPEDEEAPKKRTRKKKTEEFEDE
jgi:hypothetical protein